MEKSFTIINGPNLNLLGRRQPDVYGHTSFDTFYKGLKKEFSNIVKLDYFQSNHEGEIIDKLHEVGFSADGIVLNAGAYTHTSIAIADAIRSITTPVVEVHISDIYARESFRKVNFIKSVAVESIVGKGLEDYKMAIQALIKFDFY